VVSLGEALGREVRPEEVAQAMKTGFEKALGLCFVEGSLIQEEERLAEELIRDRYRTPEWNLRK
jgi:lipoate-protein ligase A